MLLGGAIGDKSISYASDFGDGALLAANSGSEAVMLMRPGAPTKDDTNALLHLVMMDLLTDYRYGCEERSTVSMVTCEGISTAIDA